MQRLATLPSSERDIPDQQIDLVDNPAGRFPGLLLNLIAPDLAATDRGRAAQPPGLVLHCRRRQWLLKERLQPAKAERNPLLAGWQTHQMVAKSVVLGHAPSIRFVRIAQRGET